MSEGTKTEQTEDGEKRNTEQESEETPEGTPNKCDTGDACTPTNQGSESTCVDRSRVNCSKRWDSEWLSDGHRNHVECKDMRMSVLDATVR